MNWYLPLSTLASILVLTGCMVPRSGSDFGAADGQDDPVADDDLDQIDDPDDEQHATDDDDDPDVGDDDDATDDDDDDNAWWTGPPTDLVMGTVAHFQLNCGLFLGPSDFRLIWDGEAWQLAEGDLPQPDVAPELLPCTEVQPSGLPEIHWTDTEIFIGGEGGAQHHVFPTEAEGFWFGSAWPEPMTPECVAGMDALGFDGEWPLGLELLDLDGEIL